MRLVHRIVTMEGPHEVDPSGDLIITLRNPRAPFAEAATEAQPAVKEGSAIATEAPAIEETLTEEAPAVVAEDDATDAESTHAINLDNLLEAGSREHGEDRPLSETSEIQMRVSSKHLILASPYFKAALNGPWREAASVSADCCRYIHADDWDPQAFLILMQIIHGRNRQVPRLISLELLAKIAVLVDYYKCHEAVEAFAALWLQETKSKSQLPTQVSRELVLWLCISWVFGNADIFTSVTRTALQQSQGPLATFGLPIPERIVEAIDRRRQEIVGKVIAALYSLLVYFRDGLDQCSFECSSMQLGALTKEMRAKRFEPKPQLPFLGYSVAETIKAARSIRSPTWRSMSHAGSMQTCTLGYNVQSKIRSLEQMMGGFTLEEFRGLGDKQLFFA
ncbi:hypothetical protein VTK26DRAFT_2357 [Humicola hyalothermophila]